MSYFISKDILTYISGPVGPSTTRTVYFGLRTDFPTASDTLAAMQEIGTAGSGGYGRHRFQITNNASDQSGGGAIIVGSNQKLFVFSATPNPNGATHWFIADSPDSSGNLLASGPLLQAEDVGFHFSPIAPADFFQEIFPRGGVSPAKPASQGDSTLFFSSAFAFAKLKEYCGIQEVGGVPEKVQVLSNVYVDPNNPQFGVIITLSAPLKHSYTANAVFYPVADTRYYTPGYEEYGFWQLVGKPLPDSSGQWGAASHLTFSSGPSGAPPPSPPPPPPPTNPVSFGALEIDRIRQWKHVGAAKGGIVQTNYADGTSAFVGTAISGVDNWVRLRADPRGAALIMLGVGGYSGGSGTFTVFRSADGGRTATKAGSMAAVSSLIELLSEKKLVIWMTAVQPSDPKKPPVVSTAQSVDGGATYSSPAPAMLGAGGNSSPLTGTLLDMDYDSRTDTLYLLMDGGPLRSKDHGLTWQT